MSEMELPGMRDPHTICACDCHTGDNVMHCFPCCDKTYVRYSEELKEAIPTIQELLNEARHRLTPASSN